MQVTNVTTIGGLIGLAVTKGNPEGGATGAALESLWSAGYKGGKLGQWFEEGASAITDTLESSRLAKDVSELLGIQLSCTDKR